MVECWKPVLGYMAFYAVSDRGRVRRIAGGCGARVGRVLRPVNSAKGYPRVELHRHGRRKSRTVHSLVAEAFLGPRPSGLQVNHKNGIKTDNRPGNLEYVTQCVNTRHSFDVLGRKAAHGEVHYCAKLTVVNVREIRRLYAKGGVTHSELGKQYGVSRRSIGYVVSREHWTHVA
jgi:hypothetical protein